MKTIEPILLYPYQFRVLKCLLKKPYFIQHLNRDSEQQHSPNAVKELRDKGVMIISEYKQNPDHSRTRRKVVEYSLAPESKELARLSVKSHIA